MLRRNQPLIAGALCLCASMTLAADPPAKVNYNDHILPVLTDKCLGCHNADKSRGGLDASSYVKLMEGGSSGPVVKPGEPDESRLFTLTAHKGEPKMPPKSDAIPSEQVALIKRWIEQGAIESAGSKPPLMQKKAAVASVSISKGRPAGPPPMPAVRLAQPTAMTPRASAATALAANPWSPLLAVAAPKAVLLYNSATFDLIGVLPFPHGQVNVLHFSRNGQLLLAGGGHGGKSGKVAVWNIADGKLIAEIGDEHDAVLAADISADQTQIALGGPGKTVRIYSVADGQLLREIKKHTDWVTAIEFSPDGVLLATADRSAGLWIWEANTGREFHGLRGHTAGITGLNWRDDGNVLASCADDGSVRLWEMENGKQIRTWNAHPGGVQSVHFGHDGRLVTAGRDAQVKLWDGNGAGQRTFERMSDLATQSAFSDDGARVIAGDWQGLLRVWNTADGKRAGELTTNPPTMEQRIAKARLLVTAKESEVTRATEALTRAKAEAKKVADDLIASNRSADVAAKKVKGASVAATDAKSAAERAASVIPTAQSSVKAHELKARAFAEAAEKIREALTKSPGNRELKQVVEQANQIVVQADGELTAARKSFVDAQDAAKVATARLDAVRKASTDAAQQAESAKKKLESRQKETKAINDAVAKARTELDRLSAEVAAARSLLERLSALATNP